MTLEDLAYWISTAAGLSLIFMCLFAVPAFWWRMSQHPLRAARYLSVAIILGALTAGLNTLYWQLVGGYLVQWGWITVAQLRLFGGLVIDPLVKGGAAVALFLHMMALWLNLEPDERREWTILGMAFYPKRTGLFSRLVNTLCIKRRDE